MIAAGWAGSDQLESASAAGSMPEENDPIMISASTVSSPSICFPHRRCAGSDLAPRQRCHLPDRRPRPRPWALVKGTNLSGVTRNWLGADFAGLGNKLPTSLSGVQVLMNGTAAAVCYISPTQISFQVPAGISGTANIQVIRDGISSNSLSAQAVSSAPGIFPIVIGGTNYAAAVFLDGKIAADPSNGPEFRRAVPGDVVQPFATGLAPSPAGTMVSTTLLNGVTVTIGNVTVPASAAALGAAGEFHINFTVPQEFASLPTGTYPISISINGVVSPANIDSSPPGPVVIPIQH